MPTYDYLCDACGHKFELFQGINDPVQKKCPECKKSKLRRLFGTGAAIMFKGSGFYTTDYRSDSYKKAQAADKPATSGESAAPKSGGSEGGSSTASSSGGGSSSSGSSSSGSSTSGGGKPSAGGKKKGGDK